MSLIASTPLRSGATAGPLLGRPMGLATLILGLAIFLGVQAGDHLVYIAETGSDSVADFEARSNIRRPMLATAAGKALLAAKPPAAREAFLRRKQTDEADLVDAQGCSGRRMTQRGQNGRFLRLRPNGRYPLS